MQTPRGRGFADSDRYDGYDRRGRRVRRSEGSRLRALAVFLVLVVLAGIGVWWVLRSDDAKSRRSADASPCATASGASGAADAIRVRVLNSTSRNGLAASVAAQLRQRGYTVTGIGNDPTNVTSPAAVRFGSSGAAAAKVIAALVPGSVSRLDGRKGSDVDLVLGNRFTALAPAAQPTASASGCPTSAQPAPSKPTGSPRQG